MDDQDHSRLAGEALSELQRVCRDIRSLIKRRSPQAWIGALWMQILGSLIGRHDTERDGSGLPSVSRHEEAIRFAMEYVHATVSVDGICDDPKPLGETEVHELVGLCSRAIQLCFQYGLAAALRGEEGEVLNVKDQQLAFQILNNWVMIRGRRYQVLEEEFFSYALSPHDAALQKIYGITSAELAREIQKATHAPRVGLHEATTRMAALMNGLADDVGSEPDMQAAVEELALRRPGLAEEVRSLSDDIFNGGLFNLSKHSAIPDGLLADLAYEPSENTEFSDESDVSGTPFKTLPARVKPLVRLGESFYCTDPNFIRDSSYRAIQRAILAREPGYREEWNKKQKEMSEAAFPDIMAEHLKGAKVFKDVYYPLGGKRWAETDCVILLHDVLINIEAKAGSEALAAPAENLDNHIRSIEKLVVDAYKQSKRFIDYLYERPEAPLYKKISAGRYQEVARVKSGGLRKVFPIGLTVEAFTPFSASIKERGDITPIQNKYAFMSMSIDDILVTRRILGGTGELLHYLDVRQGLASIENVTLFDEMDHLGAYISQNRFDQGVQMMLEKNGVDFIAVDGMDEDVIAPYFSNPDWPNCAKPAQRYPGNVLLLLGALERDGSELCWEADSFIRDLSVEGRTYLDQCLSRVLSAVRVQPFSYFVLGGDALGFFGISRAADLVGRHFLRRKAEIAAIALEVPRMRQFEVLLDGNGAISSARMIWTPRPSVLRKDYGALLNEAGQMKEKVQSI